MLQNQLLGGPLASHGWLVHPRANRLCMFESKYLHGVVPGRGCNPEPASRRLTFMCGFWRNICARPRGPDIPGPGQPFPDPTTTKYTWPAEMAICPELNTADARQTHRTQPVTPFPIPAVWEPIEPESATAAATRGGISSIPAYQQCFQGF